MTPADLQGELEAAIARRDAPGAVLAVHHQGRRHTVAAGVINIDTGVPATPRAIFQIGSVTKPLTAILAMQLCERGLADLDAPIRRYLPDLRLGGEPAPATVTIRRLLAHTSGLDGDFFEDTGPDDDAVERYVAACADLPFLCEPGRHFSYCNAGYAILGRLVEVVAGVVWDQALADGIMRPLGLTAFATRAEDAVRYRAAVGHSTENGEVRVSERLTLPRALGPAGFTLATTADGLVDVMLACFGDGPTLVGRETATAMRTPLARVADGSAWGLGWKLEDEGRIVGHDGGAAGQGACLWGAPDDDLAIGLVYNGGDGAGLKADLVGTLLADLGRWTPPPPTRQAANHAGDLDPYAGVYENVGMRLRVTAQADRLHVRGEHLQMAAPPPQFDMFLLRDGRFAADLSPDGEPVLAAFFEPDAEGRPALLSLGRLHRRTAGPAA